MRESQNTERPGTDICSMLSVDEARARVLSRFSALPPVETGLLEALGLVLAEDITATENIPPFRNSAMDGYAVRSGDTKSATSSSPVSLLVRGAAMAGHGEPMPITPGTAVRIMTGAPVPDGADAVVRFEDVAVQHQSTSGTSIVLDRPATGWQNVRMAGEDVLNGSVVMSQGTVIGPAHVGLLAALNRSTAKVIRRPIVAILATGDELVDLGPTLKPGQIRNSNSYLLAALTRQFGGVPKLIGIAADSEHDIKLKLDSCRDADLLVTSGGVSVGDFDVVKQVLRQEGVVDLWQLRIKPGKPMAFGRIGKMPLLGLPGNPVAAAVAFTQFGRPAIQRMCGLPDHLPRTLSATLMSDVENRGGRRHFIRGVVTRDNDRNMVQPVSRQGSGALAGLVQANCYIIIPEEQERASAGMTVTVELLTQEVPY